MFKTWPFFCAQNAMLKKILTLVSITLSFIIFSCNSNTTIETKAHIFERKLLKDGKLMICYSFNTSGKQIKDSAIVENRVLPQDSVAIVFQKNNPANSDVLFNRVTNQN